MEGHAKLVSFMGRYPETTVFRRFGTLNIQNLLYLQAQILELEVKFRQEALSDVESNDEARQLSSKDWFLLYACSKKEGGSTTRQTFLELRDCLKQYSTPSCGLPC